MESYQTQRVMLYFQIKELLKENFRISQISDKLSISRTTVYFYRDMSEEDFMEWVKQVRKKSKKLSRYESQIKNRLSAHPDLSGYQIHDWLLEHFPKLKVSRRTVSSYVSWVRTVYHLPKPSKIKEGREYLAVEDLDYGYQAQVDFGVYQMKDRHGADQKVYFMITVLSRSRYKHVYFLDRPFTSEDVVKAHEAAFSYFGGIPQQMVYDQDKLMVVSENGGEILYTEKFQAYLKLRKFKLFVCRRSDPETKGKSESVVKYVKTSFLNQRTYINGEVLQASSLAWLERTGNGQEHGTTKCIPREEFLIEQKHLQLLRAVSLTFLEYKPYHLRKDNLITYKGNRYSVPLGTYKGKGSKVWVKLEADQLLICKEDKTVIACHKLSLERGKTFINSDHKRDRSQKIQELMETVATLFSDQQAALTYFASLKNTRPRYIRDQLLIIRKSLEKKATLPFADQALSFCQKHKIFSANDFRAVINKLSQKDQTEEVALEELLLKSTDKSHYAANPQQSKISDYESIVNPN